MEKYMEDLRMKGFIDVCHKNGVDPNQLAKMAGIAGAVRTGARAIGAGSKSMHGVNKVKDVLRSLGTGAKNMGNKAMGHVADAESYAEKAMSKNPYTTLMGGAAGGTLLGMGAGGDKEVTAFDQGFIDVCHKHSINPDALVKYAQGATPGPDMPIATGVGALQRAGTWLGDKSVGAENWLRNTAAPMGRKVIGDVGQSLGMAQKGIQNAGTWLGNQTANMHPLDAAQNVAGKAMGTGMGMVRNMQTGITNATGMKPGLQNFVPNAKIMAGAIQRPAQALGQGIRSGAQNAGTWLGNQTANMHPIDTLNNLGPNMLNGNSSAAKPLRALSQGVRSGIQGAGSWLGNQSAKLF